MLESLPTEEDVQTVIDTVKEIDATFVSSSDILRDLLESPEIASEEEAALLLSHAMVTSDSLDQITIMPHGVDDNPFGLDSPGSYFLHRENIQVSSR